MNDSGSIFAEDHFDLSILQQGDDYERLSNCKAEIERSLPSIGAVVDGVIACADDRLHEEGGDSTTLITKHIGKGNSITILPIAGSGTHLFQQVLSKLMEVSGDRIVTNAHELVSSEIVANFFKKVGATSITSHSGCGAAAYLGATHKGCTGQDSDFLGQRFSMIVADLMEGKYGGVIQIGSDHEHSAPGVTVIPHGMEVTKLPTNSYYTLGEEGNVFTQADIDLLVNGVIKNPEAPVEYIK